MYGRGNYAPPPQFGQGLQRPMPPYLQQPGHPSASHFQPSLQPGIQQGGPPHGLPPRGPAFQHAPPGPPNTGGPYMHPPHSGAPQPNYLAAHQDHQPPPPPSMGPRVPPPPFMHLPPPPPPPPVGSGFSPANFDSSNQRSADSQVPAIAPLPPPLPSSSPPRAPPPPSSPGKLCTPTNLATRSQTQFGHVPNSEQALVSETSCNVTTYSHKSGGTPNPDEDLSAKRSALLDLPPPPPKPTNDNIVRNIEVLCQFIAKNGPEFEEMARKNESGNPEFNFLVGGVPGSEASRAQEYFLWMKKKSCLENDLQKGKDPEDLSQKQVDAELNTTSNSLPNVGITHSPADSDVDMEDDITQSDREHGVCNSTEDVEPEPVSAGNLCEMQKQENDNVLQYSSNNSPAPNLSPFINSQFDAETKPETPAGQPSNTHSPFRLIQNYASDNSSDDDGKPCHDNVKAMVVSPLGKSGTSSSHDDMEHGNMNLKSSITSETGLVESTTACLERVPTKEKEEHPIQGSLQELSSEALPGKYKIDSRDGGTEGFNRHAALDGNYASGSSALDSVSTYKDVEPEDKKNAPTVAKVDEFGRLVKEGASESESDDARQLRRRGRRDRSHSRSRSPPDRRRRRSPRRSPRRRKEKRSRSRSWSPKRRRSRSRSPYRSGGDFRGENLRRGKVQTRECFDFLKGRCYRGASCRYVHHEADKNESSRRYNNNPDFHGESVASKSPREHNSVKVEKSYLDDKHNNRDLVSQTCEEASKVKSIDETLQPSVSHQDVDQLVTDVKVLAGAREGDQVPVASSEPISHPCSGIPPLNEQVHPPEIESSAGAHDRFDKDPQKSDSSSIQVSASCGVSVNESDVNKVSNEFTASNAAASDFSHQASHLPPPPLPPPATTALRGPNLQVDYNILPPQSFAIESGLSYQIPIPNQQSHYSASTNTSWNTQPPHMVGPSMHGTPLQFQQGSFPVRNDFPGHSLVGVYPHQTYHVPTSSNPAQPFAGQNLVRDNRYSQFPNQSLLPSSSFVPGVTPQPVPPQTMSLQGDSTVKIAESFTGDKNHQFAQQRLPPYGPQLTASESISSHTGGPLSMPGYSTNPLDRDKPPNFFDVGSKISSSHYNPYASTFDQPLSTRFSSIAFTQERDASGGIKYDGSFGLGHAPKDGQTAGDYGSRQIIVSATSSKVVGKTLPKSGGDQYDPLFDSMDPYSETSKKHAQKQDHAADNSDIMLKLNNRHNVLDVEENNKQKVVGAVAAAMSLENEEFGETADAEVGAVENASPSNDNEDTDIAEGDIEIDQMKPEGRSKKAKDSRSMKLFKTAVVEFVKDVLKPQWRQGNMSKEVYKTIVKKTVDKVSGAMKNHRVPKSQAKIDHYIDSSRRKLTQLVEGYVSKYKS